MLGIMNGLVCPSLYRAGKISSHNDATRETCYFGSLNHKCYFHQALVNFKSAPDELLKKVVFQT